MRVPSIFHITIYILHLFSSQDIWGALVERDLSFVVYDRNTDRIIGTALNFDARNEPEVDIKSKLLIVFEFLEFCEGPIR